MTERKWTPGPWQIDDDGIYNPRITGDDGNDVAEVLEFPDMGQQIANARIIGAAPDLYEALLEALPYVPEHHGPIMHKINAALAKTRGET